MFGEISSQLTCGKLKLLKQSLLAFSPHQPCPFISLPPSVPHTYLITFFLFWQLPPTSSHSSLLLLSKSISHPLSLLLPTTHTLPWVFSNSLQTAFNSFSIRGPVNLPAFCFLNLPPPCTEGSFPWVLWQQKWTLVILLSWQSGSFWLRSVEARLSLFCLPWCPCPTPKPAPEYTNTHLYPQGAAFTESVECCDTGAASPAWLDWKIKDFQCFKCN